MEIARQVFLGSADPGCSRSLGLARHQRIHIRERKSTKAPMMQGKG